jgi:hypothetical protein
MIELQGLLARGALALFICIEICARLCKIGYSRTRSSFQLIEIVLFIWWKRPLLLCHQKARKLKLVGFAKANQQI